MDTTRIPRSGDPFSAVTSRPSTAKCAGCRHENARRDLVIVNEGRHDGLVYFHGDKLCRRCARRNGVEF